MDSIMECHLAGQKLEDTAYGYTLSLINGKYTMIVMYWLTQYKKVIRFNELQKCIGNISVKTLSATLKEMERNGLVNRTAYPEIPPRVEYSLTTRGNSLLPIIDLMCEWGEENRNSPILEIREKVES